MNKNNMNFTLNSEESKINSTGNNKRIFEESKEVMPGGVNSPVRAFKEMEITPPVIKRGKGVVIEDEDGKEYIDFVLAWGPLILGHCNERVVEKIKSTVEESLAFGAPTELELKLAKFICENIKAVEMIRMVNSGTEATMSAVKLARGYTGRDKIVKFAGCYHGHFDGFLVEAGSGVLTEGIPGSLGVTNEIVSNTLVAKYNDISSIERIFEENKGKIAGVIIEPVAGNMGVIKAEEKFILRLRELCDESGAVLIFDEVMSGFRVSFKGVEDLFTVKPDLVTFGKIMGGGLPVGAYGGRRDIMEKLSPLGGVYQAGTMSGNPVVMAAGYETLEILKSTKGIYENIEAIGKLLEEGMLDIARRYNVPLVVNRVGGMMTIFFNELKEVKTFEDVKKSDIARFKRYFKFMLEEGIYLPPSQYEALFLSSEHTEDNIKDFLEKFERFIKKDRVNY